MTKVREWHETRKTLTVSATLPPIPDDVMDAGHKALAFVHGLVGEMYRNTDLAVLLRRRPVQPSLSVAWIPKPTTLGIKQVEQTVALPRPNVDPVLTLDHDKDRFVVALYVPDEEPYMNLLREFSNGSFDNVHRKK